MSDFGTSPERNHRDLSLLVLLNTSNLLQYAIRNFYSYHCLFGLASRGLQRPPEAQMSVFGTSTERYYRNSSLLGPCESVYNTRECAPPTLDQV